MTQKHDCGLLIWWSNNSRAESILAEIALSNHIPLAIVFSNTGGPLPAGGNRRYRLFSRAFSPTSVQEIEALAQKFLEESSCKNLVLAPTSEYVIQTLLKDSKDHYLLPVKSDIGYQTLSSKYQMVRMFAQSGVLNVPRELDPNHNEGRFVAKPKINLNGNVINKPFIVSDGDSRTRFNNLGESYFAQEYIGPPSFYWCSYRSRSGAICSYFQRNLLQELGGGSIIAARIEKPPKSRELDERLRVFLQEIEYVGPFMIELRGSDLSFIEANPRFWGPLLLATKVVPSPLTYFFSDYFNTEPDFLPFRTLDDTYIVPSLLSPDVQVFDIENDRILDNRQFWYNKALSVKRLVSDLGGSW